MQRSDVLIVGAGHSGSQAAVALRQHHFEGAITLIGEEPDYPYERPPLSKEYLAGEKAFERLLFRPAEFWTERQIDLRLGQRVESIDPSANEVLLSSGERLAYGKLVWACGGMPRLLSCEGAGLSGVHSIRTRSDVDALLSELGQVSRAVVIGAGYIGLESAAVLRKLGRDVVVVEALDRVLARVAGEPISRFYEKEHRAHGVDIRTGVTVECIEGADGRVSSVLLSGGERVPADLVIVGIGIAPAVEPLAAAGAQVSNGVLVDEHCCTSLPEIYAIGDCALHRNRYANDSLVRIESVQNANDQAQTVARAIVGDPHPYETVPWFWSNQYDLRLQTIGLSVGYDEVIVRGDPAQRSFSAVYLRQGRVAALDCVNNIKDYAQGKALVQAGKSIDPALLADASVPLKQLLD